MPNAKPADKKSAPKPSASNPKASGAGKGEKAEATKAGNKAALSRETYLNFASNVLNLTDTDELEGVFVKAARDGDYSKIEQIVQRRNETLFSIDVRDPSTGNTALIWAAKRGHIKIVQLLLRYGADITVRNFEGQTALEVASVALRTVLLDSVDKGGPHRNLLQAAWLGNAKMVKKIIAESRSVDINCRNADGLTPLLLVTRDVQLFEKLGEKAMKGYNPMEVVAELLKFRADPNATDSEGKTALHLAASSKAGLSCKVVELLLKEGTEPEARDKRSFCPLHCAAQSGNNKVVTALLDGGCMPNAKGFAGATPLHIAALNGFDVVCSTLLEHQADVTLVDDTGLTPLDVAKTKKVKSTLKSAWSDATQKKIASQLGPVELRRSGSFTQGQLQGQGQRETQDTKRRSVDEIYDLKEKKSSPRTSWQSIVGSSPLDVMRATLTPTPRHFTPRRTASNIDLSLPSAPTPTNMDTSPRRSSTTMLSMPGARPTLGSTDKARITEELLSEAEAGRFTPAPYASTVRGSTRATPMGSPRSPQQLRRLTPIRNSTPRKPPQKEKLKFGPATASKTHEGGAGAEHQGLKKCPTDPSSNASGGLNVTMLGLELEERQQRCAGGNKRAGAVPTVRKGHSRAHSEPFHPTPLPAAAATADPGVEDFFLKGHSTSKVSMVSSSLEFDDFADTSGSSPPKDKASLLRPPSTEKLARPGSLDTIQEGSARSSRQTLDLDRMQLTNQPSSSRLDSPIYPNSRKVLPPTPVNATVYVAQSSDMTKDDSPRSETQEDLRDTADEDKIRLAVDNPADLTRCKSVLKDGSFNIEDSRIRESNDSGLPEDKGSSKSSSLASSDSNFSSSGESPSEGQNVNRKNSVKGTKRQPVSRQPSTGIAPTESARRSGAAAVSAEIAAKLKTIANDNASQALASAAVASLKTDSSPSKASKITVHGVSELITKDSQPSSASSQKDPLMGSGNIVSAGIGSQIISGNVSEQSSKKTPPGSKPASGTIPQRTGNSKNSSAKTTVILVQTASSGKDTSRTVVGENTESPDKIDLSRTASRGGSNTVASSRVNSNTSRVNSNVSSRMGSRVNSNTANSRVNSNTTTTGRVISNTSVTSRGNSNTTAGSRVNSNTTANSRVNSNTTTNVRMNANTASSRGNSGASFSSRTNSVRSRTQTCPNVIHPIQSVQCSQSVASPSSSHGITTQAGAPKPEQVTHSPQHSASKAHNAASAMSQSGSQSVRQSSTSIKLSARQPTSNLAKSEETLKSMPKDGKENISQEKLNQDNLEKLNQDSLKKAITIHPEGNHPDGVDIHSVVKVNVVEHTGPVIYDPFESLRREREKQEEEARVAEQKERNPKSGRSRLGSVPMKKPVKDSNTRQVSATKKRVKRAGAKSEDANAKSRPKSSKKKGKKKKKEEVGIEGKDITYISGIGWQIETEKSDVQNVKGNMESSDSDEDVAFRLNYTENPQSSRRHVRHKTAPVPETFTDSEESESNSDFEDIPAELVYNEVNYLFDDLPMPQTAKGSKRVPATKVYSALVSDNDPEVTPQTVKAISDFNNTLKPCDLEVMLGKDTRKYGAARTTVVSRADSISDGNKAHGTPRGKASQKPLRPPPPVRSSSEDKPETPPQLSARGRSASVDTPTPRTGAAPKRPPRPSKDRSSSSSESNSPCTSATKDKLSKSAPQDIAPVRPPRRRDSGKKSASPTQDQDENEDEKINDIIEEILKSTPDPTLSLVSKSSPSKRDSLRKSVTREDLEKSLNRSQVFKEVRPSTPDAEPHQHEEAAGRIDEVLSLMAAPNTTLGPQQPSEGKLRAVLSQMNPGDLEQIHALQKQVADLKEAEKEQMNRLVSNIANLELKVHVNPDTPVSGKPPLAPHLRSGTSLGDKSPRFIQKHDSLPRHHMSTIQDDSLGGNDSTFGSISLPMGAVVDSVHVAGAVAAEEEEQEDTLVRGEVVTSCLGRSAGASSRTASVMTTASSGSVADGDVETIQWKRGNLLGKGAYGKVWCGLTNAGELIAVKQIELNIDDMDRAEQEYEKIQEEVELLKTLNHKNIVGYLGTSLEDNMVSIFMQFVPGGSIASILARFGALEEEVFCHYTRQILEGVQYLHANNVIHRDIKGGNIMLMQNGIIKLIDFGCAKRLYVNMSIKHANASLGKGRLLKSMRGTPYWMAPEVVKETGHGTKSDIWSIGCTIFEMATKKPPWASMPPMSAIFYIGDGSKPIPQLPDKFSPEAIDFSNTCLTRDPNSRPSAIQLLSHPFVNKKKRQQKGGSF